MFRAESAPTFSPPIVSSDEVRCAINVLKRRYGEISVEDRRELKRAVINPCIGRLKYVAFESTRGKIEDYAFEEVFTYLICIQLDVDVALYPEERAKYRWLMEAFRPNRDDLERQGVTFVIHKGITPYELDAHRKSVDVFADFSFDAGVVVYSKWSKLPSLEVLKANKEKMDQGDVEWLERVWKGKEEKCPVEPAYWKICDVLGIEDYKTF